VMRPRRPTFRAPRKARGQDADPPPQVLGMSASQKTGHGGPGFEPGYPLSVALSGGGVRAALFGLGVLMAMRDAGKNPADMTSVSGGSITNAMLAARYWSLSHVEDEASPDLWEGATKEVFDALCAGSLTKPWIVALGAYAALPVLAVPVVVASRQVSIYAIAAALYFAWALTLLLRGLLIEAVMARRYLGPRWRRMTLLELDGGPDRQHIFCCTDLVLGKPVHYSSAGYAFRRVTDPEGGRIPLTVRPRDDTATLALVGQVYQASGTRLSAILRATAGFPGIPPRLVRWPADRVTRGATAAELPRIGFLSDGGIWNNLATEPFNDNFVLSAGKRTYGPCVVLVSDASGVVGQVNPLLLRLPGWSELKALIRQASIQNTNTVTPRRVAFGDDTFLELRHPATLRFARERLYCPVSCSETPRDVLARYNSGFTDEPDYLKYSETGLGIPERYANVERRLIEMSSDEAVMNQLQALAAPMGYVTAQRDELALYPTTLGRVERTLARGLVARGYANTALTLYLTNLSEDLPLPHGWLAEGGTDERPGHQPSGNVTT
jgi:hypothetical protein